MRHASGSTSSRVMWHEARKQEKKIRCMLVDYQRRAQRRKDYYDKIKADPTQFLQLHGRPCKIHLDPTVCIAANSSATMMPWQGNPAIMIDRFDVRAHLDYIPEVVKREEPEEELSYEERQINYERYRILVQNNFFNIPEGKFLHQIHIEEKFGSSVKNSDESKKRPTAAIGYNYDEEDDNVSTAKSKALPTSSTNVNTEEDNDSESDVDLDLTVDVSKIETQQANELNTCAHDYGMITNDFFSFLNNDLEEAENMRIAREQEEEKAMFSGRKSRKERRAFRERTLVGRKLSPPSYAWRKSPSYEDYKALVSSNRSRSKSTSPLNSGKITYITSFGGDEPVASSSTSRDITRKKISRSRSSSVDTRARRSRSASTDLRRRLARCKRSRSSSEDSLKSGSISKRSESRPSYSQSSVPETVPTSSSSSQFINNTESSSIPRYYGRNKEQSSSELSLSSDDESSKHSRAEKSKSCQASGPCRVAASNKNSSSDKLTPQERLRRKRQVMLNKQFKADKRAEREKVLKQVQERIDRAEEMKEISIKLRRRQRMLRHNDSPRRNSSRSRSSSSNDRSTSRSPYSRNPSKRNDKRRSRSSDGSTSGSGDSRNERRKEYKRHRGSSSHSRSRSYSHSPSRSRQRSRSPRRTRYSEERDSRRTSVREYDKDSRNRRYCTLSEERELARVHSDSRESEATSRRDEYKSRRERSPVRGKQNNGSSLDDRMRDRTRESDRYVSSRARYSRPRSSSRDRYSNRYDN